MFGPPQHSGLFSQLFAERPNQLAGGGFNMNQLTNLFPLQRPITPQPESPGSSAQQTAPAFGGMGALGGLGAMLGAANRQNLMPEQPGVGMNMPMAQQARMPTNMPQMPMTGQEIMQQMLLSRLFGM